MSIEYAFELGAIFLLIEMLAKASGLIIALIILGALALVIRFYKKAIHGKALVRTGLGGPQVTFDRGLFVVPMVHRLETMDITVKTITIERTGKDGLICKDNMRADIKVAFFVRVNNNVQDVINVAQALGCERASDKVTLESLFDAKFSEALKTVGKRFEFVELYNSRESLKTEIIEIIGRDLNGYVLDDCAIDYLEQTPIESLKPDNILDAEGIKKITELTSEQMILANQIRREKEKTITKQDVEARETILELQRQLSEKEEKQKREIANIKDRESAEIKKVSQEQRKIAESARIASDEELDIAQQNKDRQVIIATRNKERTDAIEIEKITRERDLQINERERIVELARIEKERAIEEERKNIQEVIRERVIVEKAVVQEEERIKDTKEFADADRRKRVAITNAEMLAEQALVRKLKEAEADKSAAEFKAKQRLIEAEAEFATAGKQADAIKIMADAKVSDEAASGLAQAKVIESKAAAMQKQGEAEANVFEKKSIAEAKGIELKANAEANSIKAISLAESQEIELKAVADAKRVQTMAFAEAEGEEKKGTAEATVTHAKAKADEEKGMVEAKIINQKLLAEADGIDKKAEAMKKLDSVGKEHEEFKLKLQKDRDVELAHINIQKDIAGAQASVISEALKAAKIEIVGGETMFFDKIIGSITRGKAFDRLVESSSVFTEIKDQFLDTSDGKNLKSNIQNFIKSFNISTEDIKNMSISALLLDLVGKTESNKQKSLLENIIDMVNTKGIGNKTISDLGL